MLIKHQNPRKFKELISGKKVKQITKVLQEGRNQMAKKFRS
jgi:hypothetical protein